MLAQRHGRVLLLTKAQLGDSNTSNAQGDIAAAVGDDDWPALHWRDTLEAGAGLSDPAAAWVLASEGPARIADLVSLGVTVQSTDGIVRSDRQAVKGLRPRATQVPKMLARVSLVLVP